MSKKIITCFLISASIGLIFIVFSIFFSTAENIIINNEKTVPFNDGWDYIVNDGTESLGTVKLPCSIEANKNDSVVIKKTLPQKYTEGMTVCFRSVHQFVRVFIDEEQIYNYGYNSVRPFGKSPGNAWNFIRLSKETAGKEISIEFISPYDGYSGKINEINYGSKNSNVFSIISDNILAMSISILIVIIGLLLLLLHAFLKKYEKSDALMYLALFSLFAGFWSMTESRMLQFFFSNQFIITLAAFFLIMLLPIPLLLFIVETHSIHNKKPFYILCWLFIVNFFFSMTLQMFGIIDFIEFPTITHALIIIGIALIICTIIVEIVKYKNKKIYILGIGSSILVIISLLDFVQFYNKFSGDTSFFFRFGVLFYIVILSYYTTKQLLNIIAKNMRTDMLEHLAYIDMLTNLHNRTAFENFMEQYRKDVKKCELLTVGIFDLNHLKYANDVYGHRAGDELIISTADCLREAFSSALDIYRIGGDEFAVFMHDVDENRLNSMLLTFELAVEKANATTVAQLSVAYGIREFDENIDKNADELCVRADEAMYEKKRMMKAELNIES